MIIKTVRDKAHQQRLVEKWTAEIKGKFPNCLIDI